MLSRNKKLLFCKSLLFSSLLPASTLLLTGCGGGNGSVSSSQSVRSATPKVTINWAGRTRSVNGPGSALSAVITVRGTNTSSIIYTVNRPDSPAAVTQTYNAPQAVQLSTSPTLTIAFYSGKDGSGSVVASASALVSIQSDGTIPTSITNLQSAIASVTVVPGQQVKVGERKDLIYSVKGVDGSIIAVSAGSGSFAIVSGADKLSINGEEALGIVAGEAKVAATIDGISSSQESVNVVNAVAATGLANSPWPKGGANAQNTGLSDAPGNATGKIRWTSTTDFGGGIYGGPSIGADGTIYTGYYYIAALDGSTGQEKWKFETPFGTYSTPAVAKDGTVYVGTFTAYDGTSLFALDGSTGKVKWQVAVGDLSEAAPTIGDDGTVYVSGSGSAYAINGVTGAVKWKFTESGYSSPALGRDGTVFIAGNNKLYSLDAASGAKKWESSISQSSNSNGHTGSPTVASDGTVYVGSGEFVVAMDGTTGAKKLSVSNPGENFYGAALRADGAIIVGTHYSNTTPEGYAGESGGRVYALDATSGSIIWAFQTSERVISSPAVTKDGTVYFGCEDNNVYALDASTGAKKWQIETQDKVQSSPAIGADGTVYVGSGDGKLYAIK